MTRRLKVSAVFALLAVAAIVSAAAASGTGTPGLTKNSVMIGGTFPLTGPAQLYGVIPKAENAYFQYVNAHGGVNGRKIKFKYYDDAYNPAQTVPLTKKLVQQDKVFAVYGSLGTAPILATRDYLNKVKVPQVLVATGDSYWATQYKKYPWTIGFQPIFVATTSAVIVCVGVANSANTFAPEAFSFTTCWLTSVCVASYFSTSTIFALASPRPATSPL